MTKLSWKPQRRGAVYCSSACGGGCKHADYAKVKAATRNLASALGPHWKPRVWENLGWHGSVEFGESRNKQPLMSISLPKHGQYQLTLTLPHNVIVLESRHPRVLITRAMNKVRDEVRTLRGLQYQCMERL